MSLFNKILVKTNLDRFFDFEDEEVYRRMDSKAKNVLQDHAENKEEQLRVIQEVVSSVSNQKDKEVLEELAKKTEAQLETQRAEIRSRQEHLDTIADLKARRD